MINFDSVNTSIFYFYFYFVTAKTAVAVWSQGAGFRCSLCTVGVYLQGPLDAARVIIYSFLWLVADDLASSAYQFQGTLGGRSISLDEMARPLIATLPILR